MLLNASDAVSSPDLVRNFLAIYVDHLNSLYRPFAFINSGWWTVKAAGKLTHDFRSIVHVFIQRLYSTRYTSGCNSLLISTQHEL